MSQHIENHRLWAGLKLAVWAFSSLPGSGRYWRSTHVLLCLLLETWTVQAVTVQNSLCFYSWWEMWADLLLGSQLYFVVLFFFYFTLLWCHCAFVFAELPSCKLCCLFFFPKWSFWCKDAQHCLGHGALGVSLCWAAAGCCAELGSLPWKAYGSLLSKENHYMLFLGLGREKRM